MLKGAKSVPSLMMDKTLFILSWGHVGLLCPGNLHSVHGILNWVCKYYMGCDIDFNY